MLTQMLQPPPLHSATRAQIDREVQELLIRRRKGSLDVVEERRLLERLIALGRHREAITLVRQQLEKQPKHWRWRLLYSQLLLRAGQRRAADEQLNLLLRLQPNEPDVLKMKALTDLNQGKGKEAIELIKVRVQSLPKQQRVPLGLLLADLQRQTGSLTDASGTYLTLAQDAPDDARPLLALALLRQEQGKSAEAQELLHQASKRQTAQESSQRPLQGLATRWALESARSTTPARIAMPVTIKDASIKDASKDQQQDSPLHTP